MWGEEEGVQVYRGEEEQVIVGTIALHHLQLVRKIQSCQSKNND